MSVEVHQCECEICQSETDHPDRVIHHQINLLMSRLDEQQRRWYAALEARRYGRGGIKLVSQITGLDEKTIRRGLDELQNDLEDRPVDRIRLPGAGRPPVEEKTPEVETTLLELVEDEVAGDPENGRCWIQRSLSSLKAALKEEGYQLCCETIRRLLHKNDIHPKSNVKSLTPNDHPDRDQQFQHIQVHRAAFRKLGWPIISVDTKKKELIGPFQNTGQVWAQEAPEVYMHDFPSDAIGKAVPYGIYDVCNNLGYVAVGQSADTSEFAVDAIVWWWQNFGQYHFPDAPELLILADSGGSNNYRFRLWKHQLQVKLVDAFDLTVTVCHYPTGASKWNPIEHRLFSEISKTWAGIPLTSFELMLDCIRATTTTTGLEVEATLFEKTYETGIHVSDEEWDTLALERHETCPDWNYTIRPRKSGSNF